jgi:hypothetical protein
MESNGDRPDTRLPDFWHPGDERLKEAARVGSSISWIQELLAEHEELLRDTFESPDMDFAPRPLRLAALMREAADCIEGMTFRDG